MAGSAKHELNAKITSGIKPTISKVIANSFGGIAYMDGYKHTVNLDQFDASSVSALIEGGFLYSTTSTKELVANIV